MRQIDNKRGAHLSLSLNPSPSLIEPQISLVLLALLWAAAQLNNCHFYHFRPKTCSEMTKVVCVGLVKEKKTSELNQEAAPQTENFLEPELLQLASEL